MITDVRNPKWTTRQRNQIFVEIKSDLYPNDGWIPYVAGPSELNKDEATIFGLAVNGHFGEIALSDEERILSGDLPVPDGYKIINGQITHLAAYEKVAMDELNNRLAPLNTEEAKARAEVDEEYAAERKAKIIALLAVKKQPGWPLTVEWPEFT